MIVGLIGAIIVGLGASGLLYRSFQYLLDLLPRGNWGIPPRLFEIGCPGALVLLLVGVLLGWFFLSRSRRRRMAQQSKSRQDRIEAMMRKDQEKTDDP